MKLLKQVKAHFEKGAAVYIICLTCLLLITCRELFSSRGAFVQGTDILGLNFYWMLSSQPLTSFQKILSWFPFVGCGAPIIITPVSLIYGLLNVIPLAIGGFTAAVSSTKIFIFLLFTSGSFSMYLLSYRLLKSHVGAFVSALFYTYNQFFLSEFMSEGHFFNALGYVLAPLVFLALDRALKKPKTRNTVILSLVMTLFLSSASHITFLLGVFLLLYLVLWVLIPSKEIKKRIVTVLKVPLLAALICFLLSAYWIIPEITSVRASSALFTTYHTVDQAYVYSYKSFIDALAIRNSELNLSGQRIPYWEFPPLRNAFQNGLMLIIPILAFAAILIRRNRETIFFTISAAISSFMALGPYGLPYNLFLWLWTNIPGYSTFRVGGRFLFITCFSYAYLIGVTVSWVYKKLSTLDKPKKFVQSLKNRAVRSVAKSLTHNLNRIFLVFTVLIIISYSWVGVVGGFKVYSWPEEYIEPYDWIGQKQGDFRILNVPTNRSYVDYPWSSTSEDIGLFSYGIHGKSILSNNPGYVSDYYRFLHSTVTYLHSTDTLGAILGIANVRYVVLEPDASSQEISFFKMQNDLELVEFSGEAEILENENIVSHVFAAPNSALVVGGRNSFMSLTEIPGFSLSEWALLFGEQPYNQPNALDAMDKVDAIIFSGADFYDLFFTAHSGSSSIETHRYAFPSSDDSSHWISSKGWLYSGRLVLGGSTLRTSGNCSVSIPFSVSETGEYDVWIRVFHAADRGLLSLDIDDENILMDYRPHTAGAWTFEWVPIREVSLQEGDHTINLVNDGSGFNDVDKIVVYNSSDFQTDLNELENEIQNEDSRLVWIMEPEYLLAEHMLLGNEKSLWWCSRSLSASNGQTLKSDSPAEVATELYIPREGEYSIAIRVLTGPQYGTLTLQVDSLAFEVSCENSQLEHVWKETGSVQLNQGNHVFKLINESSNILEVDEVILYSIADHEEEVSLENLFSSSKEIEIETQKINPSEYLLNIKTETPFFICFSESYHTMWRAYYGKTEIKPTLTYSFLNGFFIDEKGEFEVRIRFLGQNHLYQGSIISFITLATCLSYLILSQRKRKR